MCVILWQRALRLSFVCQRAVCVFFVCQRALCVSLGYQRAVYVLAHANCSPFWKRRTQKRQPEKLFFLDICSTHDRDTTEKIQFYPICCFFPVFVYYNKLLFCLI